MAVNVKMGVDLSSFNSGIREGQGILKGLNAEMKATEAEFKATGNAEKALADKTKTLNSQLNVQRGIATQAQQALKAMEEAGIKPTDQAYQKLYATMMNAQAGMNEAQAALNGLSAGEKQAAQEANNLSSSVQGISKKMSLQQVIDGVDRITSGLEKAAKKAIDLGTELWNAVMDSAKRADDTETMAKMYGIDLDTFMKMQKLVAGGMDTSVETMLDAQDKLKRGIGKDNKEVMGYLEELGLAFKTVKGDVTALVTNDTEEMFWRVGKAIMEMGDAYDQEAAASALFGKSWKELKPLFDTYEDFEAYKKARDAQVVNDEQTIRNLAELNDAVGKLESSWTTLKDELLGAIAPGLEIAADSLSTLLDSVTTYLKSDEGQEMLQKLGDAISGLFGDLSKIDPEQVVSGFVEVFTKVTDGIKWLVDNKDTAKGILAAVVGAWGTITIGGNLLRLVQFVEGLKGMGLIGGAGAAGGGGGTAWLAGLGTKAATLLAPVGAPLAGAGLSVLGIVGLQQLLKGKDYEYNDTYDANRFNDEQLGIIREAYKGMLAVNDFDSSTVEGSQMIAKILQAKMIEMAENAGSAGEFFKLFTMSDGKNLLADMMGWGMGYSGELYYIMSQAFGSTNWQQWGLDSDMSEMFRSALNIGMDKWAEQNATGALGDYFDMSSIWVSMMGHFEKYAKEEPVEVPAELKNETTAEQLAEQVGPVEVPVTFRPVASGIADIMLGVFGGLAGHANGLPFVPYDNYLARLHKGERVLTAKQNRHYTYNSNNYFGNVNLNNGQDIEALCNSIDRHNRRQRSGYGS